MEEEIQTSSNTAKKGVSKAVSDNDSADDSSDTASKKGVKGSGSGEVATISLSRDKYASNIKVDDPPVVGGHPLCGRKTL